MRLALVGISHHRAGIELRERVALDPAAAAALAAALAEGGAEAVCLSTCNRTEVYVAHPDAVVAEGRAESALGEVSPAVYRLRDWAAALHLFRVAAGLDSLVPGEG